MDAETRSLKLGVLGAGAIGCYVGALLHSRDGNGIGTGPQSPAIKVVLVGRESLLKAARKTRFIQITNASGTDLKVPITTDIPKTSGSDEAVYITKNIKALCSCDIILVCVKSTQTAEAGQQLAEALKSKSSTRKKKRIIFSFQNGVRNARVLQDILGDEVVLPCVVNFNTVWLENSHFHCAVGVASLYLKSLSTLPESKTGRQDGLNLLVDALSTRLNTVGFNAKVVDDITPIIYGKLLLNLNNALNALSGVPLRTMLSQKAFRLCSYHTIKEARNVLRRAKIQEKSLKLPIWVVLLFLRMPQWAFPVFMNTVYKIDPKAKLSMLQDLERKRKTEIQHLCGEIVKIGKEIKVPTPINAKLVELVSKAEDAKAGSPCIAGEKLARLLGLDVGNNGKESTFTRNVVVLCATSMLLLVLKNIYF